MFFVKTVFFSVYQKKYVGKIFIYCCLATYYNIKNLSEKSNNSYLPDAEYNYLMFIKGK